MTLTKLKRQSYDIGIFGKKGSGKTLLLSFLGYMKYKQENAIVFSNYNLIFPHIYINNLVDLNKIYEQPKDRVKCFLGDDFERWFHSRSSHSKINLQLNDILLDWGKVNCSLYYTAKRSMAIDLGLRESTQEFWFPERKMKYGTSDERINNIMKNYLDFYKIIIKRYDEDLEQINDIVINDLVSISKLYDTQQIVTQIQYEIVK